LVSFILCIPEAQESDQFPLGWYVECATFFDRVWNRHHPSQLYSLGADLLFSFGNPKIIDRLASDETTKA